MRITALLTAALTVAALTAPGSEPPAEAQEGPRLGLAETYVAQRVDSPDPQSNGRLGWLGIAGGGDLDDDGVGDVLVPQLAGPGRVFVFSGATGDLIRTLDLPDAATSTAGSQGNFIYLTSLPDLGSCPDGEPTTPCPTNVGPRDGVREIVVAASGVDVDGVEDIGRAYVMDGATGAMLKRVQMPPADLASEKAVAPKSFSFGRSSTSLDSPHEPDAPQAVQIGDVDGGGFPDFAIGNPTFFEEGPATNPSCDPGPCNGSGRVYVFRGEDVAGSDPAVTLDAPHLVLPNPMAQTDAGPEDQDHERFGHAIISIGDVGGCASDPGAGMACPDADIVDEPDGTPDIVVSAHATNFPDSLVDSGVMWLFDGANGALLRRYQSPEPQDGSLFGYASGVMPESLGNAGAGAHPDLYAPAVAQSVEHAGQGRGWILNGDFTTFRGTNILAQVDDPTPAPGGNSGAAYTGIGNVVGGPLNEILVGSGGPLWPSDVDFMGDVHVFSPDEGQVVLTLTDPDRQPGSGFGNGVAQLGDVNGDGLMDFAVSAGLFDGEEELNQGRLYIFRSTTVPPVRRLAGDDRIGTAVAISESTFPDPAAVDTVVVASAANYPDGLAGAPLAALNGGPLLLTGPDGLAAATEAEIARLDPSRAYVLGGPAALAPAIDDALEDTGVAEVIRVAGDDRFDTAAQVADVLTAGAVARHVYVVEGAHADPARGWPDAVSVAGLAASQGAPMLLVTAGTLPAATRQALQVLEVETATIVGGDSAVSTAVADAIRAEGVQVHRLGGATRYETSNLVARHAVAVGADPVQTWFATGLAFPDALTTGPGVAATGGVLHLLDGQSLDASQVARTWVRDHACDLRAVLVGGTAAISGLVADEIQAMISSC